MTEVEEFDGVRYKRLTAFYSPIHTATKAQIDESMNAAIERRDFHQSYGSERHWKDDKKGEYDDEYFGILAEVGFRDRCAELGHPMEMPDLYTTETDKLPEWDALMYGKTIDIKAITPDDETTTRKRLLVKLSEFKKMDYYVTTKFLNDTEWYFCGWITGDEVEAAPIRNLRFSDSHCIPITHLKPMIGKWWESQRTRGQVLFEW